MKRIWLVVMAAVAGAAMLFTGVTRRSEAEQAPCVRKCEPETQVFDARTRCCVPRPAGSPQPVPGSRGYGERPREDVPKPAEQPRSAPRLRFKPTGASMGIVHTALQDEAPMRFVGLTGGTFLMGYSRGGTNRDRDLGRHRVTISAFQIAELEVTQKQWLLVTGKKPSNCDAGCGDDWPVQNVSWLDAIDFLNALSKREKLPECYTRIRDEVTWHEACVGYRLPTEAEWEYATRAGTQTLYSFGNDPEEFGDLGGEYAWAIPGSRAVVRAVGTRKANPWGLYDVHGNVGEWVWDWYAPYGAKAEINPRGPQEENATRFETRDNKPARVIRGGWFPPPPQLVSGVVLSGVRGPGHAHARLPGRDRRAAVCAERVPAIVPVTIRDSLTGGVLIKEVCSERIWLAVIRAVEEWRCRSSR